VGAFKLKYGNETCLRVVYKATENYRKKTTLQENGTTTNTRIFAGNYEKETLEDGTIKEYHYISGPTGLIAIYIITNGTGHEMLQHFALINMNGRMYSLSRTRFGNPVLGRMLSPDNYVQDPSNAQNYNRYAYVLNNPLKYVDPSGEIPILIPIIGAIIGAYLGGAATNNWDMTPWKSGSNDKSWNFKSPDTYFGMIGGAIAGATISAYAYGLLFENAAINLTVGTSLGNTFNGFANFVVSNSGIIFEGLGYTTVAGGGAFITYEAMKGINNDDVSVEYPKYDYPFFHGGEYEALNLGRELSKISNAEIKGYYTNNGYYFESLSGYVSSGKYYENDIRHCYSYTYINKVNNISYLQPNFSQSHAIYYTFHYHPHNSPPSKADMKWAERREIRSYIIGWNGSIYGTWQGVRGYTGYTLYDIYRGNYSLLNNYYGLFGIH